MPRALLGLSQQNKPEAVTGGRFVCLYAFVPPIGAPLTERRQKRAFNPQLQADNSVMIQACGVGAESQHVHGAGPLLSWQG